MKRKGRKREYAIWALISLVLVFIWVIQVRLVLKNFSSHKESFIELNFNRLEAGFESTVLIYKEFSNYIYDDLSQDKRIINTIYEANNASRDEKSRLRDQLYEYLDTEYKYLREYELRHIQFHLLNTESFLRLDNPEQNGEILGDIRESIKTVNEQKIPVLGFEDGRNYSGFRFIYPLFYNEDHIGSVEIALCSASIIDTFFKWNPEGDYYIMVNKDMVDRVYPEIRKNPYSKSPISDNYYIDEKSKNIIDIYNKLSSNEDFLIELGKEYSERIGKNKDFAGIFKYDDNDYIVKFIVLRNFLREPMGYFISFENIRAYSALLNDSYKQIISISSLMIIIIVVGLLGTFYLRRLKHRSQYDYLTKIYNRNKFYEIIDREVKSIKRYEYPSAIMMMDIDHFKLVNDNFGHQRGDQVLRQLANLVSKNIRESDVFARWGGEEFIFLLSHTNEEEALLIGEKIRRLIDEDKSPALKDITVSIGISIIDQDKDNIDNVISKADQAMYNAKDKGRNRVEFL